MKKWAAQLLTRHLGYSIDPREVALIYNEAAIREYGEFGRYNKVFEELTVND